MDEHGDFEINNENLNINQKKNEFEVKKVHSLQGWR